MIKYNIILVFLPGFIHSGRLLIPFDVLSLSHYSFAFCMVIIPVCVLRVYVLSCQTSIIVATIKTQGEVIIHISGIIMSKMHLINFIGRLYILYDFYVNFTVSRCLNTPLNLHFVFKNDKNQYFC